MRRKNVKKGIMVSFCRVCRSLNSFFILISDGNENYGIGRGGGTLTKNNMGVTL